MSRFVYLAVAFCSSLVLGWVAPPACYSADTGQTVEAPKSLADWKPDSTYTNSIGMKLVLIPAGEYIMGSPRTELHHSASEPQHRVQITKPYAMGIYEVTQLEYRNVMGHNPSPFSPQGRYRDKVKGMAESQLPVSSVSWFDAQEFCKKLSKLEKRTYRLPTEAEWEYACRAGSTDAFHFGPSNDGKLANCDGHRPYGTETPGPSLNRPSAVGAYPPNAFRLFDMHGNVPEYCADWYDYHYYNDSPVKDPPGPATSPLDMRVVRGGSWHSHAEASRSARRDYYMTSDRGSVISFRVVTSDGD